MRKIFFSMLAVAGLLATNCAKNELDPSVDGSEVPVTIAAGMEGVSTRAIDNYGNASKVNRAILEVYYDGEVYKRMVAPLEGTTPKSVNFDLRLVSGREYDFVVWADKVNGAVAKEESYSSDDNTERDLYYETNNGLDEITIIEDKDYLGCNDDERDAFYGVQTKKVEGATSVDMTLLRPFAQLNVLTKLTGVAENDLPEAVQVTYSTSTTVAHTFNALSEETSNYKALAWTDKVSVIELATSDVAEAIHLSTDYIFAPRVGQDLVDFSMEFFKASGASILVNDKFSNIPLKRNSRTNISGELLNENVNVDVDIDSTPGGSENIEVSTVETIEDLNTIIAKSEEIAKDNASYAVSEEVMSNYIVTIPALDETECIRTFNFAGGIAEDKTLYIMPLSGVAADAQPSVLYITLPANNAGDINIDLPNTTVYINGKVVRLTAGTAVNTLIVQKDAVVERLTVTKGNVEIYGEVAKLSQSSENNEKTNVTIYPNGESDLTNLLGNYDEVAANTSEFVLSVVSDLNIQNATTGKYYATIADAIASANENDIIELATGEYVENITLDKDIQIVGKKDSDAVIVGQITTTKHSITVKDLTIKNAVSNGIYSEEGATVIVDNVTFNVTGVNQTAIMFWNRGDKLPSTLKVTNSTFDCEKTRAIQIRNVGEALVENCIFNDPHSYAVQLDEENNNLTFKGNTVSNCQLGVFVMGTTTASSVVAENNTFNSVHFAYAAEPQALNNTANTFGDEFYYYLQASKATNAENGFKGIENHPNKTVILAGSFASQINITSKNNNQTFVALGEGKNPNSNSYKESWQISGIVKFGFDSGSKSIENVTLDGLYFNNTFINQQYGGLKNVTIQNCVFNGTTNNWNMGYIVHQGTHESTENLAIKNNLFKVTPETTAPRLSIWGNSTNNGGVGVESGATRVVKNVVFEGNVMESGYLNINCAEVADFDVTVRNNTITTPADKKYLYAASVAAPSATSSVLFEGNTFYGGSHSTFYLHSGVFNDSNLVSTNNVSNNTKFTFGGDGENFDKGQLDYTNYSQNINLYYYYDVVYNQSLTSNLADWTINPTEIDKGFVAPVFANGTTTVTAKDCSYFGQNASNIYSNTEWRGNWYQTLDFYVEDSWENGSCFNFVTNPAGSDGGFPACNQILSMLKGADGKFFVKLSRNTGCRDASLYDTSKNGDSYQAKKGLALAEGWYTIKMRYYLDEESGNYACTATLLQTDNNYVKATCEFSQVNATGKGIGMESIMYFDADSYKVGDTSLDTSAKHPAIKISNQKVFLELE